VDARSGRRTLAGNPFPARTRERGHVVDILGDDVPVHHGLGFRTRRRIGDIGAAHRERGTEDDSEKQAHVVLPRRSRRLRQSMIRKACGFANEIMRANKCLERNRDSSGSDAALGHEGGAIVLRGPDGPFERASVRDDNRAAPGGFAPAHGMPAMSGSENSRS